MTLEAPELQWYLSPEAAALEQPFGSPRRGDAGFDLRAVTSVVIPAGGQVTVGTGIHLAIPEGWVGFVKDRSSMALKRVLTHGGVIDASYRGELKIILSNLGESSYHIEVGDKVAQLVIIPHLTGGQPVGALEALGSTKRGALGFGSTGR